MTLTVMAVMRGGQPALVDPAVSAHKTTEQVHGRAVLGWLLDEIRGSGTTGRTIVG